MISKPQTRFRRLLVANRSEIAIRALRAAVELGITTIAIYSQEDRFALHRFKADEAYPVGSGMGPIEAYLSIDEVIRVARDNGADAIHPGYGFLAENPDFAEACADAKIVFVGPRPRVMRQLGNKVAAREIALSAGVPVVPATGPLPRDEAEAARLARDVGYPVMLKASWGGGGRGMRMIEDEGRARRAGRGRAPRVPGRLRQRRGLPREADPPRAPRRGPDPGRRPRQPGAPARARLLGAAAQPEGGGARARALSRSRGARRHPRECAEDRPRGRLQQRRHRRVPGG